MSKEGTDRRKHQRSRWWPEHEGVQVMERIFSKSMTVCLKTITLVTGNSRLQGHKSGRTPSEKNFGLGKMLTLTKLLAVEPNSRSDVGHILR